MSNRINTYKYVRNENVDLILKRELDQRREPGTSFFFCRSSLADKAKPLREDEDENKRDEEEKKNKKERKKKRVSPSRGPRGKSFLATRVTGVCPMDDRRATTCPYHEGPPFTSTLLAIIIRVL